MGKGVWWGDWCTTATTPTALTRWRGYDGGNWCPTATTPLPSLTTYPDNTIDSTLRTTHPSLPNQSSTIKKQEEEQKQKKNIKMFS